MFFNNYYSIEIPHGVLLIILTMQSYKFYLSINVLKINYIVKWLKGKKGVNTMDLLT